jgi:hypothetical protein
MPISDHFRIADNPEVAQTSQYKGVYRCRSPDNFWFARQSGAIGKVQL